MSDIAIRVEKLSKQYKIGLAKRRHNTLRDHLTDGLNGLFSRSRHSTLVTRHSETIWALKDVSFDVIRGEVLGIIGRNGAGKTTLLKILSRITEPTGGRAEVYGRVSSLLEVGTGFHPELTGRENIYLNGAVLGMTRAEVNRQFDEIVDFSGVAKFLDTPIKRYSSGMKVRLAFSVAAHLEPEILIIDEVLAVGDAAFQKKCLGKMGDVAKGGRTVLFVSHNMAAVASLTRQSMWLDDGKIVSTGNSQEVIESYLNTISPSTDQTGFLSLSSLPRPEGIVNQKAKLEWVSTHDKDGNQTNFFAERQPIVVQLGFTVHQETKDIQFGVGVISLRYRDEDLFLVPSPIYPYSLRQGKYRVEMHIDPNYLRPGAYSLVLKMFAGGSRQETFEDTLRFKIVDNNSPLASGRVYKVWLSGFFRFDYPWGGVERGSIGEHE